MRKNKALMVAATAGILLCGGVSAHAQDASQDVNDPLEGFNRAMFRVGLFIDKGVSRPVAIVYRRTLPEWMRDTLRNVLNNLGSPIILANDILQGEVDRAGVTLVRAGVNSTIGLFGAVDVAARWGYIRHDEDFGQTLGVYGVGEGPYLFLPILGPANPRDLLGRGVDFVFDPFTFSEWREKELWQTGRYITNYVDIRERNIETIDDIERTSLDFYASVRSLYRQTRNNEIRNGEGEVEDLPDF